MNFAPDYIEHQERVSRGTVLGEGVWRRMCQESGQDPKDPALAPEHHKVVGAICAAFVVMEGAGFEGLERWLELEVEFSANQNPI
jgi:hypothetical protein